MTQHRPEIRYRPCRCRLLDRAVWAMLAKRPDGRWKIINCLDKDRRCAEQHCAFIQQGGQWPFDGVEQFCAK